VEDGRDLDALRRWAQAGKVGGTPVWVQLNHPGRQALRIAGARPVAPSAIAPALPGAVTPRALTDAEIREIVARFAHSAAVVKEAGFDGVQLHGAHGYLISQFLSPRANRREDEWGGDAVRRRRFVLEAVRATRAAVGPRFPVAIKLNSADFQRGGFDEAESGAVVEALVAEGVDLVEISGGTYESPAMTGSLTRTRESTRLREAYFLTYAEQVRDRAGNVPLMVTGGFRSRAAMGAAIDVRACDVVGLARPLALAPDGAAPLLDGSAERIDAGARRIGIRRLDDLLDLYWHTRQLHRIGAGHDPDPRESPLRTLTALVGASGWDSLRRRRGG
jgi:2,4-dienoyl-CoA reductase-like NADH-dependent reductase (Old Yellow Enzyme family)